MKYGALDRSYQLIRFFSPFLYPQIKTENENPWSTGFIFCVRYQVSVRAMEDELSQGRLPGAVFLVYLVFTKVPQACLMSYHVQDSCVKN